MDLRSPVGPDGTSADASLVKKAWTPPRLTVHGSLPTLTFVAGSPLSKSAP